MKFIREKELPYPQPWEFVIENVLDNKKNGVFIDVGAYDGNIVSNTLYMEDCLNWTGICIEPNPESFKKLKNNRNCNCLNFGISNVESDMDFYKVNGYAEMLSGFIDYLSKEHKDRIQSEVLKNNDSVDIINVQCKRLDNILKDNNIHYVDYLSIDTEGNEIRVLKSIDFEDCYIKVISSENNDNSLEVREFLKSKSFNFIKNVCGDDVYVNNNNRIL
jgi:FkbM family methyltransferase